MEREPWIIRDVTTLLTCSTIASGRGHLVTWHLLGICQFLSPLMLVFFLNDQRKYRGVYFWKWLLTEHLADMRWDQQSGSGVVWEAARALWEGSLTLAQILEASLLKWTHHPQNSLRVQKALNVLFQCLYCQLQMLTHIMGPSPLPGVLCVEPAGKASEICGTGE